MAERFSAFSFVDRITQMEPGVRAAGRFAVPPHLPRFPSCLVAEAIGQLAAWTAMARLEFRRRPVAGLAGETLFFGAVAPGEVLELAVELEACDEDAVAYGGSAAVDGVPVLELRHCVGPMLPMETFDAPEAMRADFAVLVGPGAPAGRFRTLPEPEASVIEREPGKALAARLRVPASAPFFDDHFPRRPVFPGTLLLDRQIALALDLAREAIGTGPDAALAPTRVTDVKMRAFIAPGQDVDLRVDLQPERGNGLIAALAARVDGKVVATGRVEIAAGGRHMSEPRARSARVRP
jgi:3-hydroxymyristoyl/3-hydroxydecanoyl-(acyl carrier protein) dehydratase